MPTAIPEGQHQRARQARRLQPRRTPTCGGPAAWRPGPDQSPPGPALQAALGTDNMLYIAGGLNADNMTNYDQVSRYDYTTNTWSNVASLPVPLSRG